MILDINCKSIVMNNVLFAVKNILNIIMIISPILAILSGVIMLTKLLQNPEDKKTPKKLLNSIKALVIIFFIPLLVNVTMILIDNRTDISACYNSAQKPSISTKYIPTTNKEGKKVLVDPQKYEKGTSGQLDFSCKSKVIKAELSCQTLKIVEQHYMDFNSNNFKSYIAQQGGFDNYVNTLGGIFKEYYGKQPKVTTVAEFQKVAEYVFGFLTMYGADYFNGKNDKGSHYCKWGGGCLYYREGGSYAAAASDAFYLGTYRHDNDGLSDSTHFDRMMSNVNNPNITVNCNYVADMVYIKAGLLTKDVLSEKFITLAKRKTSKVITEFSDLKVGDMVHFFHGELDRSNPETWRDKKWGHVAFVGEVYPDQHKVVMYDGGRYFTDHQNYKWTIDSSKTTKKLHGYENWAAFRLVELK